MSRRRLVHTALAFFLLFAQADAAVHVVSHLADAGNVSSPTDKQLPHSQVCGKCLAAASIDGALPASATVIDLAALASVDSRPTLVAFLSCPVPAYASRAPPILV